MKYAFLITAVGLFVAGTAGAQELMTGPTSVVEEPVFDEFVEEPAEMVGIGGRRQTFRFGAEWLLWEITSDQKPLLTTSPNGTARADAGVLDRPGTSVLLEGNIIDQPQNGGRITIDFSNNDFEEGYFQALFFGLGDGASTGYTSNGDPILARPFTNTLLGRQDSQLVAYPGLSEGSINFNTDNLMLDAELNRWVNVARGGLFEFNMMGGIRYMQFEESLRIQERLVSTDPTAATIQGTQFNVHERFDAENYFGGVQIGGEVKAQGRFWEAGFLTKLAIGGVGGNFRYDGSTQVVTPGQPTVTNDGGVLVNASNDGLRDEHLDFGIIPEVGAKVTGKFGPARVSIGYNFLLLTPIVRTTDLIGEGVNPASIAPSQAGYPERSTENIANSSVIAHGLTVGAAIGF
ncbi:hypothetical protein Pan216_01120 [Planctomycetes bacterium Pan216]|uniref:Uncharacterized protein n=1 Tax=Kolteria novifilia TaxID=2527975 RepID=A0A518AX41_9BACT|nr:hypothetical protein Pan216_01120 [Planctomycetes bacterium Pan216]